mmetsp:Transcript_106551/g.299412  ORF Transcript_106551/g.299412 Transcript_106551/m.299412 type:complete len:200 (-) Transcript_106551:741-1340(-)
MQTRRRSQRLSPPQRQPQAAPAMRPCRRRQSLRLRRSPRQAPAMVLGLAWSTLWCVMLTPNPGPCPTCCRRRRLAARAKRPTHRRHSTCLVPKTALSPERGDGRQALWRCGTMRIPSTRASKQDGHRDCPRIAMRAQMPPTKFRLRSPGQRGLMKAQLRPTELVKPDRHLGRPWTSGPRNPCPWPLTRRWLAHRRLLRA